MSSLDLVQALVTASLTVLGGVVVFVAGQIASKFFLDPIHAQRRMVREVVDLEVFYTREISGWVEGRSADEIRGISLELRRLSTGLHAETMIIPWYGLWERLGLVLSKNQISEVCSGLMGLSNCVGSQTANPHVHRKAIQKALGIPD